jgi:hypothetical protein
MFEKGKAASARNFQLILMVKALPIILIEALPAFAPPRTMKSPH